jgi:hypothetical protein
MTTAVRALVDHAFHETELVGGCYLNSAVYGLLEGEWPAGRLKRGVS